MTDDRDEEGRLLRAIEEYLAQQEAGRIPDRTEFLRNYADIAVPLRDCLESLEALHGVVGATAAEFPGIQSSDDASDQADPFIGKKFGDATLKRIIGRGGMGVVYEAEQQLLGRRIAVKLLPLMAAFDENRIRRFRHEALSAASLDHPHIVPVYQVGFEHGTHFYTMRLIDGVPLSEILRDRDTGERSSLYGRQLSQTNSAAASTLGIRQVTKGEAVSAERKLEDATRKLADIAEALDYAHRCGIVHRDVKPSNILLADDGRLWLTDFGLALRSETEGLTQTGDVLGTIRYMSPEQVTGSRGTVDHRSDIYSLGLILFELAVREPAFRGSVTDVALRRTATHEDALPGRRLRLIPPEFRTIVQKATRRDPADRYQSAALLASDLRAFAGGQPLSVRPPTPLQQILSFCRRHTGAVLTSVFVLIVICSGLAATSLAFAESRRETQNALQQSQRLLGEYHGTLTALTESLQQPALAGNPAYSSVIRRYTTALDQHAVSLQKIALHDPAVRLALMKQLAQLSQNLVQAGDPKSARSVARRLLPVAMTDINALADTSAALEGLTEPNPLFLRLLRSCRRAEEAVFLLGQQFALGESPAERGIQLIRNVPPAVRDNKEILRLHGLLRFSAARSRRLGVSDPDLRAEYEAALILLKSGGAGPETGKDRSLILAELRDLNIRMEQWEEALVASEELLLLHEGLTRKEGGGGTADQVQLQLPFVCDLYRGHLFLLGRQRKFAEALKVADEYLRVARRAAAVWKTAAVRRHVVLACHWHLHTRATLQMEESETAEILREGRRALLASEARAALLDLSVSGMRSAMILQQKQAGNAEDRLSAFEESFLTMSLENDFRADLKSTWQTAASQIADMRNRMPFLSELRDEASQP